MTDIKIIEREIIELETLACEIEELGRNLIQEAIIHHKPDPPGVMSAFPHYHWQTLSPELKIIQRDAIRKYQKFYSAGLFFIKEFLTEKESEFSEFYASKDYRGVEGVLDFLQFRRSQHSDDKEKILERFINGFEIQRSILSSIPYIIKIKEMNLREIISADFIDREIEEAVILFRKGHYRAAGALSGVALEQKLRILCDKFNIEYGKKDTIEPLAQKLYNNQKIEVSQLKNIQHLASIRDKCDHPSDIEKGEIKELIEKTKKIL